MTKKLISAMLLVALAAPEPFGAVSRFYGEFPQVEDETFERALLLELGEGHVPGHVRGVVVLLDPVELVLALGVHRADAEFLRDHLDQPTIGERFRADGLHDFVFGFRRLFDRGCCQVVHINVDKYFMPLDRPGIYLCPCGIV